MNIVPIGTNRRATADAAEFSGVSWVRRFPSSRSVVDLKVPFRCHVEAFLGALRSAGATVVVNSTLRDPRRAYLMHWCWRIARGDADPQNVPSMRGVNIEWAHQDRSANYTRVESQRAAQAMVREFGMERLGIAPSLVSRHVTGHAVDMSIRWHGNLLIMDAYGNLIDIRTPPWNGMNLQLHRVGESYGVIKYNRRGRDEPHWSDNGA